MLRTYRRHRTGITRTLYASLLASFGIRLYLNLKPEKKVSSKPRKVAIDAVFLRKLKYLLRIAFPSFFSKGTILVIAQALLLICRTFLSLQVAKLDGRITASLVQGKGKQFLKSIAYWMALGLPASAVNALIQYTQRMLALQIRSKITQHAVDQYLTASYGTKQPVYYALQQSNTNVGQLIAADSSKFAFSLAKLYANLTKPLLDVCVYTFQLSSNIGSDNVFLLGLFIQMSARTLRLTAPPFGFFVATEAELEGDFRNAHSRVVEFSEEIALLGGAKPEKIILDDRFSALTNHIKMTLVSRLGYQSFEDFVVKWLWGLAGLVSCSLPVFFGNGDPHKRAETFVVNRRLLLLSSDAVGRIMSSYKDTSALAGITSRVCDFMEFISTHSKPLEEQEKDLRVTLANYIEFQNVTICSPTYDVLVKDLNMRINQGDHLLIVGPNGSGKSSLFRVLGGLWPLQSGHLYRPDHHEVFYIPQRPYLSRGTLRQQIIYPSKEEKNDVSDAELLELLDILGMGSLVETVGGFDAVKEWREDLSMGAQQKIAAARLFYHRPKFAILDECTASVTLDTETIIYTHAQKLGITLLTVSHRASLWQYHNKILQLDGQGGYLFSDLDPSKRLALEEEKLKIDHQLRQVEAVVDRLQVLKQIRNKE